MKVLLQAGWFSPTQVEIKVPGEVEGKALVATSGQFYGPGEHDMDDSLMPYLPRSAKVIGVSPKKAPKPAPVKGEYLRDFEADRANSDATQQLMNKFNQKG